MYLDDKYVTEVLMRDIKNNHLSEELSKIFLKIQTKVLQRPNFSGYYSVVRDEMISEGMILFLKHWYKFKPYRVKNNYKVKNVGNYIAKRSDRTSKIIYTNRCFKKFDMLEMHNKTYTIKECKKINDTLYQIELFNKLKDNIDENEKVIHLIPKYNFKKELRGGFSYLTTFVFTGAKNSIKRFKKLEKEKEKFLDEYNNNIYLSLEQLQINPNDFENEIKEIK